MITAVFQSLDATTQHLTSTEDIVLGFDSPNVNYLPMCDFSRHGGKKTVGTELLRQFTVVASTLQKPNSQHCRDTSLLSR